ncbi:MAG: hypothetical protein EXR33_02545 [Betaproteobacteria bacterium]|nr:hypothetical protein [Betaproteobacteria bacterium]
MKQLYYDGRGSIGSDGEAADGDNQEAWTQGPAAGAAEGARPKKTAAPGKTSDASLKQQLAEARAQQAATAKILKVIAS